jgi:hypothetical protein
MLKDTFFSREIDCPEREVEVEGEPSPLPPSSKLLSMASIAGLLPLLW